MITTTWQQEGKELSQKAYPLPIVHTSLTFPCKIDVTKDSQMFSVVAWSYQRAVLGKASAQHGLYSLGFSLSAREVLGVSEGCPIIIPICNATS